MKKMICVGGPFAGRFVDVPHKYGPVRIPRADVRELLAQCWPADMSVTEFRMHVELYHVKEFQVVVGFITLKAVVLLYHSMTVEEAARLAFASALAGSLIPG